MSIPINTGNFDKLLDRLVDEIWFDNLKKTSQMYTQLVNVESSSKASEKHLTAVGLEDWRESGEAQSATYTEALQGFEKNYVPTIYKSGYALTREMKDDDQYDKVAAQAAKLSQTAIRTIDKEVFKMVINATNTTYYAGADTYAIASASHTNEDSSVTAWDNANTGVLNETNLETMLVAFTERKDGRGELIDMNPTQLWVPPALAKEAMILMKSTGRVGTTDNDINAYNGRLSVIEAKRMGAAAGGSDTAYMIVDSSYNKSGQGMNLYMRINPEIGRETELETGVQKYVGYMRFSLGFTDARGVEHSTGAA